MSLPALLIVDDEKLLRSSMKEYLEDYGYPVHTAASGEEALGLLKDTRVHFCIVDMRLPGMNGNELILQAHKKYPQLRFLIFTGSVDYSLPTALQQMGLSTQDILFKPIKGFQELLSRLQRLPEEDL